MTTIEDEYASSFTPSLFPFQSSPNISGTHYRPWKLVALWNLYIVGFILRIILLLLYTILSFILLVLNILLNLFGIRNNLATFNSMLYHFCTGQAVPISVKENYKQVFRMHRDSKLHTFPLFWYF